ncbi:hypothetical protein XA68_13986 [Ophiocordyceps unilateralis]|uniref:Uncharacterized protein n=1 Tax=Ophiocordyceps unilateralis TaxID=268505 RepID=A0A2A9PBD7_OPHUN|nr:hypothetical protein XA68_13986 [Ophiocordyceps unilateralis]
MRRRQSGGGAAQNDMKTILAGLVVLTTGLTTVVSTEEFILPARDIPVGCAKICGPAVELVSKCSAGKANKAVKRQVPVSDGKEVDVWMTQNGEWVSDQMVNLAVAAGAVIPPAGGTVAASDLFAVQVDAANVVDAAEVEEDEAGEVQVATFPGSKSKEERREERRRRRAERRRQEELQRQRSRVVDENVIKIDRGPSKVGDSSTEPVTITLIINGAQTPVTRRRMQMDEFTSRRAAGGQVAGPQPSPSLPADVFPPGRLPGRGGGGGGGGRRQRLAPVVVPPVAPKTTKTTATATATTTKTTSTRANSTTTTTTRTSSTSSTRPSTSSILRSITVGRSEDESSSSLRTSSSSSSSRSSATRGRVFATGRTTSLSRPARATNSSSSFATTTTTTTTTSKTTTTTRLAAFPARTSTLRTTRTTNSLSSTASSSSSSSTTTTTSSSSLRTVVAGKEVESESQITEAAEAVRTVIPGQEVVGSSPDDEIGIPGDSSGIAVSKQLSNEESCVCENESFDVASIISFCASCIAQLDSNATDKQKNINQIRDTCGFEPQNFTRDDVVSAANVRVDVSSVTTTNEAPRTAVVSFALALFCAAVVAWVA